MTIRTLTAAAVTALALLTTHSQAATLTNVATGVSAIRLVDQSAGAVLQPGAAFDPSSDVITLQGNHADGYPATFGASIYRLLGTGNFETLAYFSVFNPDFDPRGGRNQASGVATLNLGGSFDTLSFLWGSPDFQNGNFINVLTLLSGGSEIARFSASDLFADPLQATGPVFAKVTSRSLFDAVQFSSGDVPAFEFGNVQASLAPVPLPASSLLLMSAFGALVVGRRMKASKA